MKIFKKEYIIKEPHQNIGDIPKVRSSSVPSNIKGNLKTVELISKIAHKNKSNQYVKTLAQNILAFYNIPSHHYLEEARAIGHYVQQNMRYVRDATGNEQLTMPETMIKNLELRGYMMGDCDDMVLLICSLLLAVGVDPYMRCVRYTTQSGNFNHIYVVVYENNIKDTENIDGVNESQRLVIDAIIKDRPIGFEIDHMSGEEFLC